MMEAVGASQNPVKFYQKTWRHVPEKIDELEKKKQFRPRCQYREGETEEIDEGRWNSNLRPSEYEKGMQERQHLPVSCEVLLSKSRNFKACVKKNASSPLVFLAS